MSPLEMSMSSPSVTETGIGENASSTLPAGVWIASIVEVIQVIHRNLCSRAM